MAADATGRIRASDADREQAIETLKAAFVRGQLTKDELGARAGQALASRTYAELTAITADIADIAARPTPAHPPLELKLKLKPARARARKPVNRKLVACGACAIIAPALWAAFLTYYGGFFVIFAFVLIGTVLTSGPSSSTHAHRRG